MQTRIFFHANASAYRKKNHISHLISDEGIHIDNHDAMCGIVLDYFKDIFTEDSMEVINEPRTVHNRVTAGQNNHLMAEVKF